MRLSPLNQRRWRNFTANRRAYWSMILFAVLFGLTLFAEVLANDKPLLVSYRGEMHTPFLRFYSEQEFGGDFQTEANYKSTEVQCLIVTGGLLECFDDPVGITAAVEAGSFDTTTEGFAEGWIVWAPIPYSYNTINDLGGKAAPSAPDAQHWLGTDDASRDVLARVIYGFRLSVAFALMVTALTSVIGIAAGAVQGYFGGRVGDGWGRTSANSSSNELAAASMVCASSAWAFIRRRSSAITRALASSLLLMVLTSLRSV